MPLSWNEIRHNAIRFSKEWAGARRESAEKQTFWNEFFDCFGIKRRTVASFEEPVKRLSGDYGFIDLFWPGVVLVEHKSFGADLGKAESQAFRYIRDLAREGRQTEIPRYVIVSDFARMALYDLEPEEQLDLPLFDQFRVATLEFPLAEFHQQIYAFAFIPGYKQHRLRDQDPINIQAVEILGKLHDALEEGGYKGHDLEQFLVRVLFCLFAEDTSLFEREGFRLYLENRTTEDGSDLGLHLARLFDVFNTPTEKRQKNLDETLAAFPYVNGELFQEKLGFADFNRDMRNALLACTRFDWSRISPAIFGSLFQAVMEPRERRQIGAHYTSERDILKVVHSLFLDDLRAEFQSIKATRATSRRKRLEEFQQKLRQLRFLDPACGCGNFLVVTYRELRDLELDLLKELFGRQTELTLDDINRLSQVDVDQFFGIEIGEWPARIAEVALWLMDHQMNLKLSEAFGQLYQRLPLKKSPHIRCANALRTDWKELLPPAQCSYILGNPPFVGAKYQTDEQRSDMDFVAGAIKNSGLLDYVTGWYFKAAEYIQNTKIVTGFVSTNSITQGEQAGVIWEPLFQQFHISIHFAHRTFPWESEARGKAHVHVVIIGFGAFESAVKRISDTEQGRLTTVEVRNISPYLVEGPNLAISNRSEPLCDVPSIGIGNKPIDGGYYLFTPEDKAAFLKTEPEAKKYFRRWYGSAEFVKGIERWCLWLGDCPPDKLRQMPQCIRIVQLVAQYRRGEIPPKGKPVSDKNTDRNKQTVLLANTPTKFHVENMPHSGFLVIPETGSEKRHYLPVGFMTPKDGICSNLVKIMPNATLFHFGILSSTMHLAWMHLIGGRMKSDPRYSVKLVYNNFPWPQQVSDKHHKAVEDKAQAVLDTRALFPEATLADLYDPLTMPAPLVKAHDALDRAVDRCYREKPFENDRQRVEFLFALYEQLTAPLLPVSKTKRTRSKETKPLA